MATSVIPAVIDYLYNTFTAAATLGAATPPVRIYDGPAASDETSTLILWVGIDDPDAIGTPRKAADSTSTWLGVQLGQQKRDESISILCVADAWVGEGGLPAGTENAVRDARVAAYGITAAVETLLRADLTLGGNVPIPGFAAVSTMGLQQDNTGRGVLARVPFTITARTRI